jgi:hypothetical protein
MRLALVIIVLAGVAFGYHQVSSRSASPHDRAVASLKSMVATEGSGDAGSVECNANPTPEPAGYAAYGRLTMFDCRYRTSTGSVVETCMMSGGKLDQFAHGRWASDGESTCAAAGKELAKVASLTPGSVTVPTTP